MGIRIVVTSNKLTTLRATATMLRRVAFEGREHLVAPVVAVREGVLNGELVPAEEIGRHPGAWNGIPLPIDHPMDRGVHISANRPDLIETRSIGRFWNARFDGQALHGELWVDVEKARTMGGDALKALEKLERGEPLEVSTAYFQDIEQTQGTYNGRSYSGIQRNLRPDHLALLPNSVGACSWADGCGAPRVNKSKGGEAKNMGAENKGISSVMDWPKRSLHFIQNMLGINADDLSHNDLERRLKAALKQRTEWVYIHDTFDNAVVYDDQGPDKPTRLLRRGYSIDANNVITLNDEYEEVVKVTRYEPVRPPAASAVPAANTGTGEPGGENQAGTEQASGEQIEQQGQPAANTGSGDNEEGNDLKKAELVNGLITNSATQFTEADRQWLEGLAEEQLSKLAPVPAANQAEEKTPCGKVKTNEDNSQAQAQTQTQPQVNAGQEPKPKTMEEWIAEIPDEETREFMINSQKKQKTHREKLITDLAANKRCAFDKDELAVMKTNQLEKLAASLQPENYSGMGGPRANQSADDEIPAPPPVVLAKREEK